MIRYAVKEDTRAAYKLVTLLGSDTFTYEQFETCFIYNLINNHIILFEENGDAVGIGMLCIFYPLHHAQKIAEVMELVVMSDTRGKGIGRKLLDEMTKIALNNECAGIELASNKKRIDAHRFYKREGFSDSHLKFTKPLGRG